MNEVGAAAKFIRATLAENEAVAALVGARIYELEAPDRATYPLLVFSHAGGPDRLTSGTSRLLAQSRWLVLAVVDRRDMVAARAIASAADNALVGSTGNVTLDGDEQEYHVQTIRREEPVERGGRVDSKYYSRAGGFYRAPTHSL